MDSPNGSNLTVRIPGFGQFVLELNGVCGCECTNNPVRPYFILAIFVNTYIFYLGN